MAAESFSTRLRRIFGEHGLLHNSFWKVVTVMAGTSNFETKWELLVADSWDDPALKERLLTDPHAVLKERGIRIPEGLQVRVVADSADVEHLVLPSSPKEDELNQDELSERELYAVAGGASRSCRSCRTCRTCRTCKTCRTCRNCRRP